MKKKFLVLASLVVLTFATPVLATVGARTASLTYRDIKITMNGNAITPKDANGNAVEPFIIDGTTYLPVRAVSDALGLNVAWDNATNTVSLEKPGVFKGGVEVYKDDNVVISFAGCRAPDEDSWLDEYYADFYVTNKTDATLTFQPDSLSFDGISYKVSGSEEVAPQSTGKISFYTKDVLPTTGISKTSGEISVIDFERSVFDDKMSYNAKWVNVTK